MANTRKSKAIMVLMLPGIGLLLIYYVIPFLGGIGFSLISGGFTSRFVGIENYLNVWQNPMFLLGLKNTLKFSVICAPLLWTLSFLLASFMYRAGVLGYSISVCALIPYFLPSSSIMMIWTLVFDYGGIINRTLGLLNQNRVLWIESEHLQYAVIVLFVWKNTGICSSLWLAAIKTIPNAYNEYAKIEGAGYLYRMFKIVLPLVLSSAFLVLIVAWINAFKVFKEIYYISGAYPSYSVYTLQHYINNMMVRLDYQNVTAGTYTFATIEIILFWGLLTIQQRMTKHMY